MKKSFLRKGLVLVIIIFFIGYCFIPINAKPIDNKGDFKDKWHLIIGFIDNLTIDGDLYRFECVLTNFIDQHGRYKYTDGSCELKGNYIGIVRLNFIFCIGHVSLPYPPE
jgi:hypothetical protein